MNGPRFEIHDHEAAQAQMVEQEVEVEVIFAHGKMVLASDEGEALTEFEEELLDMAHEALLQFGFAARRIGA